MEIALLSKSGLRIKSKKATFAVDNLDKSVYEAVLFLSKLNSDAKVVENTVVINGQGEYEIGGVKITGTNVDTDIIYSMQVDGIDILLGNLATLEKAHTKLKEHNVVVANCIENGNSSFITSLAENVVMFYGDKAAEVSSGFGKESVKNMNKYSSTKDKLPTEVETILLANS